MKIVKERTRLIISDFSEIQEQKIRDLVTIMDGKDKKVFIYKDEDTGIIYIPPGMEGSLLKAFRIRIDDRSKTYWDYTKIKAPVGQTFKPRNQLQEDAINFALNTVKHDKKCGLILPPGSGKTFISSYCAVKLGLRTLIVAPTKQIRDQWQDTLIRMMGIDKSRVGVASNPGSLVDKSKDFVLVLHSTLTRINKDFNLEDILRDGKFGIKIIDEAHLFFNNIIRLDGQANIRYNWYLTATFGRSADEENMLYHRMFGDIDLFRVRDKKPTIFNRKPGDVYGQPPHMIVDMFWFNSGLSRREIESVEYRTKYGISIPKYTELIIPASGEETKFIKKVLRIMKRAEERYPYGRTLVLTPTISSVETLAKHIRRTFPNKRVGTIHSKNDRAENERVKANDDIIISTVKSSGVGFDVKDLAKLICLEQFKSLILTEQVSGRLRRRPDGKDTYMADIVDSSIRQLRVWGSTRAQFLKRKSKKFKVIDL